MPYITSPVDGARLFYIDYRPSATESNSSLTLACRAEDLSITDKTIPANLTVVFLHGWPMSSEMYTHLLLPLSQNYGIRCIAPDRRGFGRSEWVGAEDAREVNYETFARDTVAVLETANIEGCWVWAAASMGCGESVLAQELMQQNKGDRFRSLATRCKGYIWMGPSMPYPLKSENNPTAPDSELWKSILAGFRDDRVAFVKAAIDGVFGSRPEMGLGIELPASKIEYFEHIVRQADALAIERCLVIITGKDFTSELAKMDKRVLVLHGDGDHGMPASASADLIKKLMPEELYEVKIYDKASHGLYLTHADQVMRDLLDFVVSVSK